MLAQIVINKLETLERIRNYHNQLKENPLIAGKQLKKYILKTANKEGLDIFLYLQNISEDTFIKLFIDVVETTPSDWNNIEQEIILDLTVKGINETNITAAKTIIIDDTTDTTTLQNVSEIPSVPLASRKLLQLLNLFYLTGAMDKAVYTGCFKDGNLNITLINLKKCIEQFIAIKKGVYSSLRDYLQKLDSNESTVATSKNNNDNNEEAQKNNDENKRQPSEDELEKQFKEVKRYAAFIMGVLEQYSYAEALSNTMNVLRQYTYVTKIFSDIERSEKIHERVFSSSLNFMYKNLVELNKLGKPLVKPITEFFKNYIKKKLAEFIKATAEDKTEALPKFDYVRAFVELKKLVELRNNITRNAGIADGLTAIITVYYNDLLDNMLQRQPKINGWNDHIQTPFNKVIAAMRNEVCENGVVNPAKLAAIIEKQEKQLQAMEDALIYAESYINKPTDTAFASYSEAMKRAQTSFYDSSNPLYSAGRMFLSALTFAVVGALITLGVLATLGMPLLALVTIPMMFTLPWLGVSATISSAVGLLTGIILNAAYLDRSKNEGLNQTQMYKDFLEFSRGLDMRVQEVAETQKQSLQPK